MSRKRRTMRPSSSKAGHRRDERAPAAPETAQPPWLRTRCLCFVSISVLVSTCFVLWLASFPATAPASLAQAPLPTQSATEESDATASSPDREMSILWSRNPLKYRVLRKLPHETSSFTQGLFIHDDHFYEGTGLYGQSKIMKVDIGSGKPVHSIAIENSLFGEGITTYKDKLYQLTWKEHTLLVYSFPGLELLETRKFSTHTGQGWGITATDTELVVSDGSAYLMFWDPETLEETRRVKVTHQGRAINGLNELEMVNGVIIANVWFRDYLVRIDPKDGSFLGVIDMKKIKPKNVKPSADAVLNGIAHDPTDPPNRLYVTGKMWPAMFHIEVFE